MADSPWDMLSAIGTITAVIVALGVSGQATLANRKADKDRSELVAAKMLSPLLVLERRVSYLQDWFSFDDEVPTDQYTEALLAIQQLEVMAGAISIEDLYPLLHLRHHAAKRSARALGLIPTFTADATAMLTHHSWGDGVHHKMHRKRWAGMLSEIQDHLAVAVSACAAAASTGAPRPTPEEIHGP